MKSMSSLPKKSRRASRAKRGQQPARVWQFEQLESRAMLAVMGPMPYYAGDHGPQTLSFSEPHRFEATMFVPPQFQQSWTASPVDRGWDGGPMHGGFHDDRMMFGQFDEPFEATNDVPANLAHSNYTQPAPPPPTAYEPQVVIREVWLFYDNPVSQTTGGTVATPSSSPKPDNPQRLVDLPGGPTNPNPGPLATDAHYNYNLDGAAGQLAGLLSSTSSSATSAILQTTREIEPATFVWTGALDAALQSYTSQLLLATSAASGQMATSIKSSDQSLSNSDPADDFIRLGESASQDLFAASTDAIVQERAEVEAVLKNLKDADDLPSKLDGSDLANAIGAPQDQEGQIADLVFGSTFDLADADGGMILLKATGDANESPISLASVAEAHPDLFSGHVGVEPSIGLYQAIDMGVEELSATENAPVAKPSAQPSQQAKPDNRYSSNAGNGTSSRKAAAALTVSTLAGGLLWVASRKKSDEDDAEELSASQLTR